MALPCQQDQRINHLEGDLAGMVREIRDDQRQSMDLLAKIAAQGEAVSSLKKGQNILFDRVRVVEEWKNKFDGGLRVILALPVLCSVISALAALWAVFGG